MEPTRDFTSEQILRAHIGFLRLMVEAMSPETLPARSQPIDIAAETAAVWTAVQGVLAAGAPSTRKAIKLVVERIRPGCWGADPAFAGRVEALQGRILALRPAASGSRATESTAAVFALWRVVAALVATGASEDRLLSARLTAERSLAALGDGADDATQLSIRAQADFYAACLEAYAGDSAATAPRLH